MSLRRQNIEGGLCSDREGHDFSRAASSDMKVRLQPLRVGLVRVQGSRDSQTLGSGRSYFNPVTTYASDNDRT
jgi:hypothetical protein